jgi:hypothetical protein
MTVHSWVRLPRRGLLRMAGVMVGAAVGTAALPLRVFGFVPLARGRHRQGGAASRATAQSMLMNVAPPRRPGARPGGRS